MPKVRDILKDVRVENAKGVRSCRRDQSRKIIKGEACLVIMTGSPRSPQSYCKENAQEILDKAWSKLITIYRELNLAIPYLEK